MHIHSYWLSLKNVEKSIKVHSTEIEVQTVDLFVNIVCI